MLVSASWVTSAIENRAANLLVASSLRFDVVRRGYRTEGGRSLIKVSSSFSQIFGIEMLINSFAWSNIGPVVRKKYKPSSSDFVVGSILEKNLYRRISSWTVS